MNVPDKRAEITLYLSREEAWIVHHVLLNRMEREATEPIDTEPPPLEVFRTFEKVEDGTAQFTAGELHQLSEELARYTERSDIPSQDLSVTRRLLSYVRELSRDASDPTERSHLE